MHHSRTGPWGASGRLLPLNWNMSLLNSGYTYFCLFSLRDGDCFLIFFFFGLSRLPLGRGPSPVSSVWNTQVAFLTRLPSGYSGTGIRKLISRVCFLNHQGLIYLDLSSCGHFKPQQVRASSHLYYFMPQTSPSPDTNLLFTNKQLQFPRRSQVFTENVQTTNPTEGSPGTGILSC